MTNTGGLDVGDGMNLAELSVDPVGSSRCALTPQFLSDLYRDPSFRTPGCQWNLGRREFRDRETQT